MPRHILTAFAALLLVLTIATELRIAPARGAVQISDADRSTARQYYDAVDREDWRDARAAIERVGAPLLAKALRWHLYGQENSGASFTEITSFLRDNPRWPGRILLARRAEQAVGIDDPADALIAWFEHDPPERFDAWQFYIRALRQNRGEQAAADAIRTAWRTVAFGRSDTESFLARHRDTLDLDDHRARMAMLLRRRSLEAARHLFAKVSFRGRESRILEIRIGMLRAPTANRVREIESGIEGLPAALQREEDMLYDRIRWYRKRRDDRAARALLALQPDIREHRRRWWTERSIQIRESLEFGESREAYDLAAGHEQVDADTATQAETLAGWIAYRYLRDDGLARPHLTRAVGLADSALTRAHAAYWLGQVQRRAGNEEDARRWYAIAAAEPGTFYGQLAQREMDENRLELPADIEIPAEAEQRYRQAELTSVTELFGALDDQRSQRIVLWRRIIDAEDAAELAFIARHARELGSPEFEVRAARRAIRDGRGFIRAGFPNFEFGNWPASLRNLEKRLVLAVIRQESSFHAEAGSHAGARGLMQLRPATARAEARRIGSRYSESKLTEDARFNVLLGSHYLHRLLIQYDGNYVLAVAAYNAGFTNVDTWIERVGDPRDPDINPVHWIERIPFGETREYVRRVLQNLEIYRALAGEPFTGDTLHEAWTSRHYAR